MKPSSVLQPKKRRAAELLPARDRLNPLLLLHSCFRHNGFKLTASNITHEPVD
jgi:hypothetical protein